MADTNFFELFTVTWAQAGTVDVITDVQYKTGWTYIGSLPPTVEQFNKVQQLNDEKMGWIYRQLAAVAALTGRPLSAAGDDAISFALQNLNASNLSAGTVPVARLAGTASSLTAGAATKLAVSRSFSVEGGATAAAQAFDGTGDVKLTVTGLDVGKANAGVLAVARGGTGLGAVAAGDYLVGAGGGALVTKTPAQVLNHIGGAPLESPGLTGTPTAPTPTAGDSTTRLATTAFVQNAAQSVAVPPGFVLPFAASTPPAGWLRANGAAVSRTTYAALFAAIGTTYGAGDGSTTFNLPDVSAEFPRFWDDGRGIDANPSPRAIGSSQLGTALVFDIGSSASVAVSRVLGLSGLQSRAALGVDSGVVSDYNSAVGYYSNSSTSTGGLPESAELNWGVMRPRNIALLGCIKY